MRGWEDEFQGGVLNYARTIVAVLWDFEMLHSCLLAVPDASRLEWIMDLNVDQPLNGVMTHAFMNTQGSLGQLQCFMKCVFKRTARTETYA